MCPQTPCYEEFSRKGARQPGSRPAFLLYWLIIKTTETLLGPLPSSSVPDDLLYWYDTISWAFQMRKKKQKRVELPKSCCQQQNTHILLSSSMSFPYMNYPKEAENPISHMEARLHFYLHLHCHAIHSTSFFHVPPMLNFCLAAHLLLWLQLSIFSLLGRVSHDPRNSAFHTQTAFFFWTFSFPPITFPSPFLI